MAFFAILELLYKDHDAAITVNGGCLHLESEEWIYLISVYFEPFNEKPNLSEASENQWPS